jgi:hypothetical protein
MVEAVVETLKAGVLTPDLGGDATTLGFAGQGSDRL